MACNADDIAKIQRTKKLEILRTHPVQLHIELQPLPLPQNMRESGLSMRPQSDYAPGHAHVDRLGRQFIRGFRFVCRGYTFRRVGPIEFMRVGIASLRDDICHLLASLQKLIERLEFQSRSFRRVVRKYNGAILTASRKRLAWSGIMPLSGGGTLSLSMVRALFARRRTVRDDWIAWLPPDKLALFKSIATRWERNSTMSGIVLHDAL